MSNQETDRTKLTFSQAEGIDPLPQPAALGELSQRARTHLWNVVYLLLKKSVRSSSEPDIGGSYITEPWKTILLNYHIDSGNPVDEFHSDSEDHFEEIKDLFMEGDYNRVFDFLTFVLRHPSVPVEFRPAITSALEKGMCAYTVVEDGPTIIPIVLPEQRESIQEAFQVLKSGPFEGAQSHLRQSAECINKGDLAESVRESIHAVESVARCLAAGAGKSLKPALDALSEKVDLHGAFKKGIENLYGYTNDEDGIRHALLEEQANVDTEDAVFMFGACASFAAYLVNKARKAGLIKTGGR